MDSHLMKSLGISIYYSSSLKLDLISFDENENETQRKSQTNIEKA